MRSKRKTHGRRRRKTTKIYSNRYKTNKRRRRKWKGKRTSRNINHGRKKLTYSLHGGANVQNTKRNAAGKLSINQVISAKNVARGKLLKGITSDKNAKLITSLGKDFIKIMANNPNRAASTARIALSAVPSTIIKKKDFRT